MALTATIYVFQVQLADVDRAVYADLELRVARHPSESAPFMLARLLAYCLEYREGITFTDGIGAVDEPAVLVRDLTGRITAWIEVGAPDADRLHRGSKLAGCCALYTHKNPAALLAQFAGRKIHRAAEIPLYSFGQAFMEQASAALQRRTKISLSITERQIYMDVDGQMFTTQVEEQRLG